MDLQDSSQNRKAVKTGRDSLSHTKFKVKSPKKRFCFSSRGEAEALLRFAFRGLQSAQPTLHAQLRSNEYYSMSSMYSKYSVLPRQKSSQTAVGGDAPGSSGASSGGDGGGRVSRKGRIRCGPIPHKINLRRRWVNPQGENNRENNTYLTTTRTGFV